MMKVAVLSRQDPYDRMTFSGTSHSMVRQLEKYFDVVWIDPTTRWSNLLTRLFHRGRTAKFQLNLNPLWVSRIVARNLNRRLAREPVDVVFNIGMSAPLSDYRAPAKVMTFADATMKQMIAHYYTIEPDQQAAVKRNEAMEKTAFDASDIILTTSHWCRDSVIEDYQVSPEKVAMAVVGANMSLTPQAKTAPAGDVVRLLFIGIDPERKGLAVAADAVAELNRRDPAKRYILDVVGLSGAEGIAGQHVVYHGLLNKNIPEEEARLKDFYRQSDLFILPTRLDTIGIVFLEASSFGLPILTCHTGGVPEYVIDGQTGYCLPLAADGAAFADKALELLNNPAKYEAFSQRAAELIETQLNWDHWGEQVAGLINQL